MLNELAEVTVPPDLAPASESTLADVDFRLVRGSIISSRGYVPPVYEIAPILLRSGGPALVTASPERFKSWLGMETCVSLATGSHLFGEFAPTETRPYAIYLDLDAGAEETENKFAMFGQLPDNLMVASWEPTEFSFEALEALLAKYPSCFLVIDCLSSIYCPDASQDINRAMRIFLVALRRLYRKYDANGLLIDHDARLKREASESYSGPAQKKASIRSGLNLDFAPDSPSIPGVPTPAGTTIRISPLKMSAAAPFRPFDVRFSFPEGSRYQSEYLGTVEDVNGKQNDVDAVVAAIRSAEKPLSGRAIKAMKLGISEHRVEAALAAAEQRGAIRRTGKSANHGGYVVRGEFASREECDTATPEGESYVG